MIPLDANAAPSNPRQPGTGRINDEAPQNVPHLLIDDITRSDGCRCCSPDIATMTTTARAAARHGDKLRATASLRPRAGRVQRTAGPASRRRRSTRSTVRHGAETAEPNEMVTPFEGNGTEEMYSIAGMQTQPDDIPQTVQLPFDPRQWSRDDVQMWLRQMALDYRIAASNDVIAERFPTNGKGLVVMLRSSAMFTSRLPQGGHILYNDFLSRVLRAMTAGNTSDTTSSLPERQVELKAA